MRAKAASGLASRDLAHTRSGASRASAAVVCGPFCYATDLLDFGRQEAGGYQETGWRKQEQKVGRARLGMREVIGLSAPFVAALRRPLLSVDRRGTV